MDMPRQPFVAPGGVDRPYPSYWDYTQRDYGNRVGIYRLMRVLDQRGLRATALMNAAVATRYPALAKEIAASQWEVAAAGLDMGHLHHGGLAEAEERALVKQAVGALRGAFASKIRGWHSPAHSRIDAHPRSRGRVGTRLRRRLDQRRHALSGDHVGRPAHRHAARLGHERPAAALPAAHGYGGVRRAGDARLQDPLCRGGQHGQRPHPRRSPSPPG